MIQAFKNRLASVTDGTSNTLMLAESRNAATPPAEILPLKSTDFLSSTRGTQHMPGGGYTPFQASLYHRPGQVVTLVPGDHDLLGSDLSASIERMSRFGLPAPPSDPNQPQELVVIAIIAILIGLLLPAVQKAR